MASKKSSPKTVRGQRRYEEIIEAATEVFLERGYAGASIDAVVARAGGSKETLYSLFGNKAGLLVAMLEQRAESLRQAIVTDQDDSDIETLLTALARRYLSTLLEPRLMALFRLVCSEAMRHPQIGDLVYRSGAERQAQMLATRLSAWNGRGSMDVPEPLRMAELFFAMLRGNLQMRLLLNPTAVGMPSEVNEHADYVVKNFLRMCNWVGGSADPSP